MGKSTPSQIGFFCWFYIICHPEIVVLTHIIPNIPNIPKKTFYWHFQSDSCFFHGQGRFSWLPLNNFILLSTQLKIFLIYLKIKIFKIKILKKIFNIFSLHSTREQSDQGQSLLWGCMSCKVSQHWVIVLTGGYFGKIH